jgi:hypothetical protein
MRISAVLVAMTFLAASSARAQKVTLAADGRISFHVLQAPLGHVLRAIGEVSPFEKLVISPDVEGRPVTLTVDHVDVDIALLRVLRAADVDYVLAGSRRLTATAARSGISGSQEAAPPFGRTSTEPLLRTGYQLEKALVSPVEEQATKKDSGHPSIDLEAQARELEQALTVVSPPLRGPGTPVELPFPSTPSLADAPANQPTLPADAPKLGPK